MNSSRWVLHVLSCDSNNEAIHLDRTKSNYLIKRSSVILYYLTDIKGLTVIVHSLSVKSWFTVLNNIWKWMSLLWLLLSIYPVQVINYIWVCITVIPQSSYFCIIWSLIPPLHCTSLMPLKPVELHWCKRSDAVVNLALNVSLNLDVKKHWAILFDDGHFIH